MIPWNMKQEAYLFIMRSWMTSSKEFRIFKDEEESSKMKFWRKHAKFTIFLLLLLSYWIFFDTFHWKNSKHKIDVKLGHFIKDKKYLDVNKGASFLRARLTRISIESKKFYHWKLKVEKYFNKNTCTFD